jgi:hypothetical protein
MDKLWLSSCELLKSHFQNIDYGRNYYSAFETEYSGFKHDSSKAPLIGLLFTLVKNAAQQSLAKMQNGTENSRDQNAPIFFFQ